MDTLLYLIASPLLTTILCSLSIIRWLYFLIITRNLQMLGGIFPRVCVLVSLLYLLFIGNEFNIAFIALGASIQLIFLDEFIYGLNYVVSRRGKWKLK